MNKNTFEFSDALGDMDDFLVSEAVHASESPGKSRLPIMVYAAATLVFVIGTSIMIAGLLKQSSGKRILRRGV